LDGLKRTELVTSSGADQVKIQKELLPLDSSVTYIRRALLASPMVPARKDQVAMAQPLIQSFVEGLGKRAEQVLSSYLERATARFLKLVGDEQRKLSPKPRFEEVVAVERLQAKRTNSRVVSADRVGKFSRQVAYEGWQKSIYAVEWFDSAPERDFALAVDSSPLVDRWVRLHRGELPILWRNEGREYHADFVVVEAARAWR
jgi:type III restriction enzyme